MLSSLQLQATQQAKNTRMKRLTTTFQGMEFIKILLEALGWNAFSPCKAELQHQSPVAELTAKLRNIRLWRGPCKGTSSSVLSPGPAPETAPGWGENASYRPQDTCESGGPGPPHPTETHQEPGPAPVEAASRLLLACKPTEPRLQVPSPPLGSRGTPAAGDYMRRGGPATSPAEHLLAGCPTSRSTNWPQEFGEESILFMLKRLACGQVMNWNAIKKKKKRQNKILC